MNREPMFIDEQYSPEREACWHDLFLDNSWAYYMRRKSVVVQFRLAFEKAAIEWVRKVALELINGTPRNGPRPGGLMNDATLKALKHKHGRRTRASQRKTQHDVPHRR